MIKSVLFCFILLALLKIVAEQINVCIYLLDTNHLLNTPIGPSEESCHKRFFIPRSPYFVLWDPTISARAVPERHQGAWCRATTDRLSQRLLRWLHTELCPQPQVRSRKNRKEISFPTYKMNYYPHASTLALNLYVYSLNCTIHTSKTTAHYRERVLSLTLCSAFNHFFPHMHYSKSIIWQRIKQRKEAFSPCLLAFLVSPIYHLIHLHHELQMIHTVTEQTNKHFKKSPPIEQQQHLWGNDTKKRKQFITQKHIDQSSASWQIIYFGNVQNSGELWKLFIIYRNRAMCCNNNVLGPTSSPFQTAVLFIFALFSGHSTKYLRCPKELGTMWPRSHHTFLPT